MMKNNITRMIFSIADKAPYRMSFPSFSSIPRISSVHFLSPIRRFHLSSKRLLAPAQTCSYDAPFTATKAPEENEMDMKVKMDPAKWGRIHSFESFSSVDGPGIRYVVFLQGCHYRCVFCSNPDSWNLYGGKVMSVEEVVSKISKCLPYLKSSNGGITVSGGEPLVQPEFVHSLFSEVRKLGLTTALDTTGFAAKEAWDEVLPVTDYVLLCVKHTTEKMYSKITRGPSKGFKKMYEFAAEVGKRNIPLTIRYVLVPGLSDSQEDLNALATFAKAQPTLMQVELLPLHSLGVYKWKELNLDYPLANTELPSKELIASWVSGLKSQGLNVLL